MTWRRVKGRGIIDQRSEDGCDRGWIYREKTKKEATAPRARTEPLSFCIAEEAPLELLRGLRPALAAPTAMAGGSEVEAEGAGATAAAGLEKSGGTVRLQNTH